MTQKNLGKLFETFKFPGSFLMSVSVKTRQFTMVVGKDIKKVLNDIRNFLEPIPVALFSQAPPINSYSERRKF